MNTEHYQKSAAYLDGVLMSFDGDKVVIISYGSTQSRFYVSNKGEVSLCGEQGPNPGGESDFELYRMALLEALIDRGSLIIRQVGVGKLQLPPALGGITVPVDHLSGASIDHKGIKPLRGEELKILYQQGVDGAVNFIDFPSKEQVKVALIKQIEAENSPLPEAMIA